MAHPPYHPSDGELSIMAFFVIAVLIAIPISALCFNLRNYRFWKTHPGPETDLPLHRVRRRCVLLSILLLVILGLSLWRFLPLSMDQAADLEPQSLSAAYSTTTSTGSTVRYETGMLSPEEAAPLLDALEHTLLRRDFRNLLPIESFADLQLLDGRQAVITLSGKSDTQVLTFYGAHLLTLETGQRKLCYHFYDPEYANRLFLQLENWRKQSWSPPELSSHS